MSITRRIFLRNGALAVVGTAAVPAFLTRAAYSAVQTGMGNKRLVVIFQRGAADGLNIVVPHGEPGYYAMRPSINIPRSAVIDLDGFFGLHPAMSAFQPLWAQRHLAIVHAAGSPDPSRSHFDAQDFMESGTPGIKATEDGWLNRALHSLPSPAEKSAFRAIGLGPSLPRILAGPEPAVAVNNINDFGVGGRNPECGARLQHIRGHVCQLRGLRSAWHRTGNFRSSKDVEGGRSRQSTSRQPVPIIPRDVSATASNNSASSSKPTSECRWRSPTLADGTITSTKAARRAKSRMYCASSRNRLSAFWTDLGDLAEDTVVVTMSEFGRTARENGNRGTDHGHANVMFVMGGPVKGGKVYGSWPGLDQSQLYEGRDLAVTTDFRRVLGEAVYRHLGNQALNQVFPGFDNPAGKFLKYLG